MTVQAAAQWLRERDNFLLLTHVRPDGDTLGSAAALCQADEEQLAVHLVAGQAVDHMAAGLLQPLGPVDVVFLVEAGAQLHHAGDGLAPLGRVDERLHDLGVGGHPV